MTFVEWLEVVKGRGLICDKYMPMVLSARSRKQFMDIALDVNGISFLCDMIDEGSGLPYDVMLDEFVAYINGRYIHVNSSTSGSYSASMYCQVLSPREITASTTLLGIFGCKCDIHIPKNHIVQLCVDSNSDVNIILEPNSKCYVDLWRGGNVQASGDTSGIIIKNKSYGG